MAKKSPAKPQAPKSSSRKPRRVVVPAKTSTATAPDVVNKKLVDTATTHIRKTLETTIFKGMTDVGEYIFDKFFGGDADAVHSKDPTKSASFRALAARCGTEDLPISKSWLYNAVGVVIQSRVLGAVDKDEAYLQLTPSHRVRMLPLREDAAAINSIAKKAVIKGWTVKDIKAAVDDELDGREKDGRGRKPDPLIIKALKASNRAFNASSAEGGTWNRMAKEVDEEHLDDAIKQAQLLQKAVERVLGELEKRQG